MAQNIIPSTASTDFPGCAISCAALLSAEQVCEPPDQATTNQLTYDTCFCNSVSLAAFATTPDALCTAECTVESDRVLLQQWFNSFCAQVKAGVDPVSTRIVTATVTTSTSTQTTQTTATGPLTLTTTTLPGSTGAPSSHGQGGNSWIDNHWKYILMICIIVIGLAALAVIAVYLKKRHRKRLEQERATASGFNFDPEKRQNATDPHRSATPNLWGPHQAQHATQGYLYDTGGAVPTENLRQGSRRGKSGHDKQDVVEFTGSDDGEIFRTTSSNRRARPSELEMNARMIGAADRRSKSQKGSRRRKPENEATDSTVRSASGSRSRRRSRPRRRNSDPEQARRS